MIEFYAGIDVQIKRGCCYYVIDKDNKYVENGWIKSTEIGKFKKIFSHLVDNNPNNIAIGIDAPRMPLEKLRIRYFDRSSNSWFIKNKESIGRECEVIINSFRIANCQWTNIYDKCPEWMKLGFSIFRVLMKFPFLYEIFPSASYKMLRNDDLAYEICLRNFKEGVKDMLDASVGAITVKEFSEGRGEAVGGEDGLGTIILPRKIKD